MTKENKRERQRDIKVEMDMHRRRKREAPSDEAVAMPKTWGAEGANTRASTHTEECRLNEKGGCLVCVMWQRECQNHVGEDDHSILTAPTQRRRTLAPADCRRWAKAIAAAITGRKYSRRQILLCFLP